MEASGSSFVVQSIDPPALLAPAGSALVADAAVVAHLDRLEQASTPLGTPPFHPPACRAERPKAARPVVCPVKGRRPCAASELAHSPAAPTPTQHQPGRPPEESPRARLAQRPKEQSASQRRGRTLKSMPIVVMNDGVQLSSQKRRRRHDFPTPSEVGGLEGQRWLADGRNSVETCPSRR